MKKTLTILILFACVTIQAQNWKRPVAISLYHVGTVLAGSLGDAYNDSGNKPLGHVLKAVEVSALISGPMLFKLSKNEYAPYIATYVGWRVVGYDYGYNAGKGLPWDYNGDSSNWDRFLNKQQPSGIIFARSIVLVATIHIPIKYF